MTAMKPGASRHRLAPALVGSVLLHLVAGAWLWFAEKRVPPGPEGSKATLVELEFTDVPPASPPPSKVVAPKPASEPRPVPRPVRKQKPAETVAERPRPAEPAQPQEDRPVAGAAGPDAPRKLVLVPSWPVGVPSEAPESRGRTLHPGDPALAPESTAETSERLTARVQDWADDGAAVARAGGIGRHPYFKDIRGSMEGALSKTEGGNARQLGISNPAAAILKNYAQSAEQYAQTGSPGGAPPSRTPRDSERLAERFKDEPSARRMRMGVQARETLDALNNQGALLSVTLELRQGRSGELLDAKLTEASGNPRFDAFVLRVVPGALGPLKPPPEEALRGRDFLKTQWQVEGWLYASKEMLEAASSLASGQLMLPLGLLLKPEAPEPPRFEYRARLLKVY